MDTQQKLNHSSPIVQRVFRLRERLAWQKALTLAGKRSASADMAQARTGYQWQMWQKSDFSAYAGDGSEHLCNEANLLLSIEEVDLPLSIGREEDGAGAQDMSLLS
jgi:hypothetical protein